MLLVTACPQLILSRSPLPAHCAQCSTWPRPAHERGHCSGKPVVMDRGQGTQIEIIIIIIGASVVTQREPPWSPVLWNLRCTKEEERTPVQEVAAGAGLGGEEGKLGTISAPGGDLFCGRGQDEGRIRAHCSPHRHPSLCVPSVFVCHQLSYLGI